MPNSMVTENKSEELSRKIEQMAEADIETVMEIERKSFDSPWRKKSFIEYAERGCAFVVHTTRNVIVGYVLIERKGDTIELHKMAIDPDYQRKGLGTFIIGWARGYAKDRSAARLLLNVRASNHQAIEFYRNTGFEVIRRRENYYERTGLRSEDKAAIEMQWLIQ